MNRGIAALKRCERGGSPLSPERSERFEGETGIQDRIPSPAPQTKKPKKFDDGVYRGLSRLRDGLCRPKHPEKFFANPEQKIDLV